MPTSPYENAPTAASLQLAPDAPRTTGIAKALEGLLLVVALATSAATLEHFLARWQPLAAIYAGQFALLSFGLGVGSLLCCAALGALKKRAPAPASMLLRQAFVCFVGAAILCVVLVEPYRRLGGVLMLAVAANAFAVFRLSSPIVERRLPRRLRAVSSFVVFQVCVIIVASEIALRQFATIRPSPLFARSGNGAVEAVAQQRYTPDRVRYEFRCNSLGYYDDEWASTAGGKRRVALIGDSFVVGVVPHYYHFATVCERECGAELCSVGVAGVGPFEYLYLLETDGLALDPDLVVVSLFVGNDFIEAEGRYAPRSFGRDWLDAENLLVMQLPHRLRILMSETSKIGHSAGGLPDETTETPKLTNDPVELAKDFPWLDDPSLETEVMSSPRFLGIEIGRAFQTCRADAPPPTPIYAAIRAIHELCGSRPLAFLVIPDQFQVEDDLWDNVVKGAPGVVLDRDRPQRLLAQFFADEGIPWLDVLPLLRAAPPLADGKSHVYALRDSHINRRGNEIVGKALAEFLRPRLAALDPR